MTQPMQEYPRRGLKANTIKAVLAKKVKQWIDSITDEAVKRLASSNAIVTGGCIASMLLGETVNDYDIYFADKKTAVAIANYYVFRFNLTNRMEIKVDSEGDHVRIVTRNKNRGETAEEAESEGNSEEVIPDLNDIEDRNEEVRDKVARSQTQEDKPCDYRPVFLSTGAITLSGNVQLVIRFYGKPDEIHENYDFVHATNWFTPHDKVLELRPKALESLLSRELRYVGSRYPICSIIRLRKFISRGWTINAGQILKMAMQVSELDLTKPEVLEDQLTGVDVAYFIQLIEAVREKDPEKVNAAYLVEIIDRLF